MSQTKRTLAAAAALALAGWIVAGDAAAASHRRHARAGRAKPAMVTATAPTVRPLGRGSDAENVAATGRIERASVVFVTDKRAYLNRGARDGLAPRQTIQLLRGGRVIATCAVESVSDHQATCTGARPRVGDGFATPARGSAKKQSHPLPNLAPVVDEQTLRERAAVVGGVSYEKVDFNGAHTAAGRARAMLSPQLVIWHSDSQPNGNYTLEELDASLQVYDMGGTGLDFSTAFTAMRWGSRSTSGRFRPASQTQFYLWEAEFARRHVDARTVVAVGRIWPWHTPGLAMLDGLQIGRRNKDETAEAGVYVGFLPVSLSTAPSAEAWAGGAYGTLAQTGSSEGPFRLAREEVRIGVWNAPGTGMVTDADVIAQTWIGMWNIAAGGRALLAPSVRSGPVLDRASLDLGARPSAAFGAGAHLRYFASPLPMAAALTGVLPTTQGMLSAIADAHWNASASIGLAAFGSYNQERDTGQSMTAAGAELRFPRVGDGLTFGGQVETGWLRGALTYGQLATRAAERLHLLARLSLSITEFTTPTSAANVDEAGGYLHVEGVLAAWLRLRLWSLLRAPILIQGGLPQDASYGVAVGASLTGAN